MAKRSRQTTLFDTPEPAPGRSNGAPAKGLSSPGVPVPAKAEHIAAPAAEPSPPTSLAGKSVYVIDGHSLIYQLFHALPELSSPAGEPVGAVYGFARDLLTLLEKRQPDYLFCAFDVGKTFRHDVYPEYKANRPEMPDDLTLQIQAIHQLLEALGIPAVSCESFEADDILATIARQTEALGGDCFLVTGDKDCRQLITDRVKLYNLRKDQVFDRQALQEEWGITPEQVVDFQALVGDATDNVPGVRGVGPKAARDLLQRFGTLEGIYAHLDEVDGQKRRQSLAEARDLVLKSRELVRLNAEVPCVIPWESAAVGRFDVGRVLEFFRQWGFRGIGRQFETLATRVRREPPAPTATPASSTFHLVDTAEGLSRLVEALRGQSAICVDLETRSIDPARTAGAVWPRWAEIVGIALAWNDQEGWYVPVAGPPGQPVLDCTQVLASLRKVLEDPSIVKVGQNLKYDMIVLRNYGIELAGVAFDTMVASYLLDAGQRNHNLDDVARRYLGEGKKSISELIGSGKQQKQMDQVDVAQVAEYACRDAVLPLRLRPVLAQRLAQNRLDSLFANVEMPLVEVLAELEYHGIRIDCERLAELSRRFGQQMAVLEEEIYRLAGRRFNIGSPKQLQQVLFDELKLPVVSRTQTGRSTDADVLEELAPKHPLPAKILEYRQYAKLKSTYVDALPQMVHPRTGRVHASFHQAVTATGRLSSSDPNLQNIPVRGEAGREIRAAFVAGEPGWLLLAADYSQIELRVLAHYSGDPRLCEAFARDEDIHAQVASQIYRVPLDQVTPDMRRQAKAVNFGVLYGQSPFGLARELGISKEEAARFIDSYFEGYPGIEEFLRRVLAECHRNGYVCTILGRQRAIRGVRPDAGRQRNLPERTAINTVIQGSAADLIKLAMVAIHRRLRDAKLPARMLLQIHDELVFEVEESRVDDLAALVRHEMSSVHSLSVPLKVDVKVGPNWADTVKWGE